jgi:hypothetical protein
MNRPVYKFKSIPIGTSAVFSTEDPKKCILVVRESRNSTLRQLFDTCDADRVESRDWIVSLDLERRHQIYTQETNGRLLSLRAFVTGLDEPPCYHDYWAGIK